MNVKRISAAIGRVKKLPGVRTFVALQARYGRDDGDVFASALTYKAFLSLFPLLLLGLSILGYVMSAHPALRGDIARKMAATIPGLGTLIGDNLAAVQTYRTGTGLIGLAGLAWSGTGIVAVAQLALARVFEFDPPSGIPASLRRLGTLSVLGVLAVGSSVLAGIAGGLHAAGAAGVGMHVLGAVLTFVVDVGLFLAAYRILSGGHCPLGRKLVPGALLAGAGWTVLKVAGSWYASRTVTNAHAVYGTFAATVGILVLLSVGARLFVYGAELIAVLDESGGRNASDATNRRHRAAARTAA